MKLRGDHHLVKKVNRTQILEYIRKNGPVSITQIAERTQLTFPAVSNIVKELQKASMLSVLGAGKSSGGRKPLLYKLNAEAFYVIGVDLSVDDIKAALFNFETQIVAQERRNVPESGEPEDYVQSVVDLIQSLIKQAGIAEDKILGVGVSAPGPINEETGEMIHPPNLPRWSVFPFRRRLEEELRTPVKLEKDANVSALGEKWFGAGQDANHLIYIMVGEGIGGGIVIGGQLYRGNRFGAGEIGHGTIDLDGPRCHCGNYGCLEAMASGLAMVRRIGEELRRESDSSFYSRDAPMTLSLVLKALRQGDPLTRRVVEEASAFWA